MPLLTTAEQRALRTLVHTPSLTGEQTVNVYRNAAVSGGRTGAPTLATTGLAVRIRPASQNPRMSRLLEQIGIPLNSARVSHIGKASVAADVRQADEWRMGSTVYKVESVGLWQNAIVVGLMEVKAQL